MECYWFAMDRHSMIATARWITSGGTGAFSAFRLPDDVLKKARLSRTSWGDIVPLEFRDTPLVDLLRRIDFTSLLDTERDASALLQKSQSLAAGYTVTKTGAWFNADLDSTFQVILNEGRMQWSGVPYRYYWDHTDGPYVRVKRIVPFLPVNAQRIRRVDDRTCPRPLKVGAVISSPPRRWQSIQAIFTLFEAFHGTKVAQSGVVMVDIIGIFSL
jgi:hypothetical protein